MWAGPVASASAGTQPRAASPSPARVKFYVVPPPGSGHAESLFTIAAETLGDGRQFMEIFRLNKGRLQPNGGRLTNPRIIEPGWILQLPSDAAGPGVHLGALPVVTPPTSHQPSRPGGTGSATMISGPLLAFVVAGLAVRLIQRRAGPSPRHRPAHARTPGPRATGRAGCSPTTRLTRPNPGPGWQSPAARSGGAGRQWAQRPQHGHDRPAASPASPRQAPGRSRSPAALRYPSAILTPGIRWRAAQPGGTPGSSPQTYLDVSRLQVAVTEASAHDWEGARSPSGREMSVRMANPTLPDADHQAAGIRHQAPTEAAAIRQAAERDAAELRATPAAKPPGRPRQYRAMRLAVLAMTIPILFGLVAATTELALHGYGYFVFRSAGTGATQQGPSGPPPSQPPTAHHRGHAGRGQNRPPCASSPGSETARAIRTS
jgi:hypothetical protein